MSEGPEYPASSTGVPSTVGSASVAKTLIAHDLVDEFRLKVFPLVIGTGTRLFDASPPVELELTSTEQSGAAALLTYQRASAA